MSMTLSNLSFAALQRAIPLSQPGATRRESCWVAQDPSKLLVALCVSAAIGLGQEGSVTRLQTEKYIRDLKQETA